MFTFTVHVFPIRSALANAEPERNNRTVVVVHATSYEKALEKVRDILPAPPAFYNWHVSVIEIKEILESVFVP